MNGPQTARSYRRDDDQSRPSGVATGGAAALVPTSAGAGDQIVHDPVRGMGMRATRLAFADGNAHVVEAVPAPGAAGRLGDLCVSVVGAIAALVLWMAVLLPGSALAQSSTCQAYNPQMCTVGTGASSSSASATLPFTGLDLLLLAVGGGILLITGLVVRRLARAAGDSPEPPV